MDAADSAELASLRRRAYGPTPDIESDPRALARLISLEDVARGEHDEAAQSSEPESPSPIVQGSAGDGGPRHPEPSVTQPVAPEQPGRRSGRLVRLVAVVAVVIGVVVWVPRLLGGDEVEPSPAPTATTPAASVDTFAAYSFTRDRDAVTLREIPVDGPYGEDVDLRADRYVPDFPTSGEIDWATELGQFYGWHVWIAGGAGVIQREQCLLIERGAVTRSRCVPAVLRENAALVVAVPYGLIVSDERPAGMVESQRLGFWWHDDDGVRVMLGADPPL